MGTEKGGVKGENREREDSEKCGRKLTSDIGKTNEKNWERNKERKQVSDIGYEKKEDKRQV